MDTHDLGYVDVFSTVIINKKDATIVEWHPYVIFVSQQREIWQNSTTAARWPFSKEIPKDPAYALQASNG